MSAQPFPELSGQSGTGDYGTPGSSNKGVPSQSYPATGSSSSMHSTPHSAVTSSGSAGGHHNVFPGSEQSRRESSSPTAATKSPASMSSPSSQMSTGGGAGQTGHHPGSHHATPRQSVSSFNPLIYGNDVDSVDVATRVAMVNNCSSLSGVLNEMNP